jgi:hypothetical protein
MTNVAQAQTWSNEPPACFSSGNELNKRNSIGLVPLSEVNVHAKISSQRDRPRARKYQAFSVSSPNQIQGKNQMGYVKLEHR